jgi:ferrous iron transport protein A
MAESLALSQLSAGSTAEIVSYPLNGTAFLRLREMGLLPGTKINLLRVAPFGDPIEIKVRGYNLTLRKTEADHILVDPAV